MESRTSGDGPPGTGAPGPSLYAPLFSVLFAVTSNAFEALHTEYVSGLDLAVERKHMTTHGSFALLHCCDEARSSLEEHMIGYDIGAYSLDDYESV